MVPAKEFHGNGMRWKLVVKEGGEIGLIAGSLIFKTTGNCTDGDVRLVGGTSPLNGRVEVCYRDQWGGVCSQSEYSRKEATVVCRQLGYPYDAVAYSSGHVTNTTTFLNVDFCDVRADELLGCYSYADGPSTPGYYACTGYSNVVVNCTSKSICIEQIFI